MPRRSFSRRPSRLPPTGYFSPSRPEATRAVVADASAMREQLPACPESILGMEDGRCDHEDHEQQRDDNGRHDPLGETKLLQECSCSLRRERAALSHRWVPWQCGDNGPYADVPSIASAKALCVDRGLSAQVATRTTFIRAWQESDGYRDGRGACCLLRQYWAQAFSRKAGARDYRVQNAKSSPSSTHS